MDAAADFRLRADPARGGTLIVTLLAAMLALGYVGINYLYQRVNPSPQQIFDALAATDFDQPLPAPLSASRGSTNPDRLGGYTSVLLDIPQDPPHYEGPEAVIAYVVADDLQEVRDAFEEYRESHLRTAENVRNGDMKIDETYEVGSLPLAEENYCVVINSRTEWCAILVGPVWIDITSRMEMLDVGEDRYLELARAALDHLREAAPGVD